MNPRLRLKNIGQISEADITFGNLTVLVGPQATGKSVTLQLLKLLVDTGHVLSELKRYGLDWSGKLNEFLDVYLGEGMNRIWREGESSISWKGEQLDLAKVVTRQKKTRSEAMFFIPAQRVLTLRDGWPRPFTDYSPGDPFAVREFSEKLRLLLEQEFKATEGLFPQKNRLKKEVRELLAKSFFPGYNLQVDRYRSQRRLVLQDKDAQEQLPFMVWSAGQREFVPLLLGFYWLMPPTKVSRRENIEWVVIEELEMGLHPQAISVTMLMVLELLSRGYRVCLSTHSPHVLDVIWALQTLKANKADSSSVLDIFESKKTDPMHAVAEKALGQSMKVYYFDRQGSVQDISQLDPASSNDIEAGWGGITEFSGRVAEVVSKAVTAGGRR
ncbi:MAG: ATP-binding protein [Acidobacteria bacterium]|nr:ATP-binding protein [Acidobacteriota bacterium]